MHFRSNKLLVAIAIIITILGFSSVYNPPPGLFNNEMRPHFSCNLMTPNQAHLEGKFDYKKWGNFSITEIWN